MNWALKDGSFDTHWNIFQKYKNHFLVVISATKLIFQKILFCFRLFEEALSILQPGLTPGYSLPVNYNRPVNRNLKWNYRVNYVQTNVIYLTQCYIQSNREVTAVTAVTASHSFQLPYLVKPSD